MGGLQYTNGSNSVPVAVWEFEQVGWWQHLGLTVKKQLVALSNYIYMCHNLLLLVS